jgi:hypothetical protein
MRPCRVPTLLLASPDLRASLLAPCRPASISFLVLRETHVVLVPLPCRSALDPRPAADTRSTAGRTDARISSAMGDRPARELVPTTGVLRCGRSGLLTGRSGRLLILRCSSCKRRRGSPLLSLGQAARTSEPAIRGRCQQLVDAAAIAAAADARPPLVRRALASDGRLVLRVAAIG